MLIQSQNAFFETLQRSAQNTSPSKPAGSDSSPPDTSSQRVGFAQSPKTSLNQVENSLGKGGLKALFSGGSVYQGLSTLAEARNTGPTTVQPVSATEALAEGGEIPPVPDPQNVVACVDFIQAHKITAGDVLNILNEVKIKCTDKNQTLNFRQGYETLLNETRAQISATYFLPKEDNNSPQILNPHPDPNQVKKAQVLYSILQNAYTLTYATYSPRKIDFNTEEIDDLAWISENHLSLLKSAFTASESGNVNSDQTKIVNTILNEVTNHPCDFLKETIKQDPFKQIKSTEIKIKEQIKQEVNKQSPTFLPTQYTQQIGQTLYQKQYQNAPTTSKIFSTQLTNIPQTTINTPENQITITDNHFSIGPAIDISIKKNAEVQSLIEKSKLPNAQEIAKCFYNLPEPLRKNYASHIHQIIWAKDFSTSPNQMNFLVTHTEGMGKNARSKLEISSISDNYKIPARQAVLYNAFVHELGHVFYDVTFTQSQDGQAWNAAIRNDNFQPLSQSEDSRHPNAITIYAEKDESKLREDFGETFAIYILSAQNKNQDIYRAAFPHRFAIIDKYAAQILNDEQLQYVESVKKSLE